MRKKIRNPKLEIRNKFKARISKSWRAILVFVLLATMSSAAEQATKDVGVVCVDLIPKGESWKANETGATETSVFTVSIDDLPQQKITTESAGFFKDLSTGRKHLVKVHLDGKLLTSFRFTFEANKSTYLQLWYNPFYGTWSLSDVRSKHKCMYLKLVEEKK